MPKLFGSGILAVGDAAGLGVNNGFVVRGMDLAIGSAMAAAETVLEARGRNDFSAESLGAYKTKLDQSAVMADMRTYRRAPGFFQNPRMYQDYPALLTSLMERIYLGDDQPKEHILPMVMKTTRESGISIFDLLSDVIKGMRAL